MCQDGAYKLSTLGWSYEAILRHFYTGVRMIDLTEYLKTPEADAVLEGRNLNQERVSVLFNSFVPPIYDTIAWGWLICA